MILSILAEMVENASYPEDIFEWESSRSEAIKLLKIYRGICFSDKYPNKKEKEIAEKTFKDLNNFWKLALLRFNNNTYGDKSAKIIKNNDFILKSKINSYIIGDYYPTANLCNVYYSKSNDKNFVIKVAKNPIDNDLLENESTILKLFNKDKKSIIGRTTPILTESFKIKNKVKQKVMVNVIDHLKDYVPSSYIHSLYQSKLNPRHIIWIWKRILMTLYYVHERDYIHGAILPDHIMINVKEHSVNIIDWTYAVKNKTKLKLIDSTFKSHYPTYIFNKKNIYPKLDIYMSAKLIVYLLGGNVNNNDIPEYVPLLLKNLILSCIKAPGNDCKEIYDYIDEIAYKIYGKPKFIELKI